MSPGEDSRNEAPRRAPPRGPRASAAPPAPGARAAPPAPASRVAPVPPAPLDPEAVLAESTVEFVRASGPGGQHRNKRETGVRLTHGPTGIVVMATERRSQSQNRALALERMVERLEAKRKKRKPRKATRKGKGVRARELDAKRMQSERKRSRRSVDE
jgi:protein subunit release factor B